MKILLFIINVFFTTIVCGQKESDFKKLFQGHPGTMVIKNTATGEVFTYNKIRSRERFLPASTFKIPNSLIGLETGVIKDENFVIKWDGIHRDNEDWNRDHTLASAIKFSVVPYFQELARRAGKENEQKYLNALNYGNKKIGSNADYFWLDNSLKISAVEQILFLENFYNYNVPFSRENVDVVKNNLPYREFGNVMVKFKTGTGKLLNNKYVGWLVGYVEKEKNVYLFAFNVEGKSYAETKTLRDETPFEIFNILKIIE